jgi:hypothetical protein
MANTSIQLKKSGVTGNVPSSLEYGELALNYADGKLYYRAANNTITYIQSDITTDSFATINANSSLILATSPTDTLSIIPGNNITILADTISKTIVINADTGSATDSIARNLAQNAYDTANSASANTIIIQGVDDWQNTEIIAVNQFAQAAYNQANTGGSLEIVNDNTSNNVYYINFTANTSGNVNTLFTSNNNLTFNPSTGTLNVKSLDITANSNISSKTFDATETNQVVIDSFSIYDYRSVFYQIQMEASLSYHMLNLNVLQNGGDTFSSIFGEVYSSSSLGSFSSDIFENNVRLLFIPSVDGVTVTFIKNSITQLRQGGPIADLGFVGQPVTITFDAGLNDEEVEDSFDYGFLT